MGAKTGRMGEHFTDIFAQAVQEHVQKQVKFSPVFAPGRGHSLSLRNPGGGGGTQRGARNGSRGSHLGLKLEGWGGGGRGIYR